ncbi:hypothetical protein ACIPSJ_49625 [Streptomyces sp. NPDC090088]|uniref:hypothetical protein n=1 Tax=Streptomyces sp. NPDC090088 TaxID=3365944 RepID=UPI00381B3C84
MAQLIVLGVITADYPHKDPAVLAETLWTMHHTRRVHRDQAVAADPGTQQGQRRGRESLERLRLEQADLYLIHTTFGRE